MALTDDAIKAAVEAGYAAALKTSGGANADYIPYLAKVPSTLCATSRNNFSVKSIMYW